MENKLRQWNITTSKSQAQTQKSTALDFAHHLHTDIGDKFIKAIDARTKQPVGKDHPLKHRDGIEIMTN